MKHKSLIKYFIFSAQIEDNYLIRVKYTLSVRELNLDIPLDGCCKDIDPRSYPSMSREKLIYLINNGHECYTVITTPPPFFSKKWKKGQKLYLTKDKYIRVHNDGMKADDLGNIWQLPSIDNPGRRNYFADLLPLLDNIDL